VLAAGSQRAGAGKDLVTAFPYVRRVYEEADDTVKFPLSKMIWEGQQVSGSSPAFIAALPLATAAEPPLPLVRPLLSGRAEEDRERPAGHLHSLHGCMAHTEGLSLSLSPSHSAQRLRLLLTVCILLLCAAVVSAYRRRSAFRQRSGSPA
jgi:hypothetical protein